jgi:hypothetical protein
MSLCVCVCRSSCEAAAGGHEDVLEELDSMAALAATTMAAETSDGGGESPLRLVGILRAADMFWNVAERIPVLCLMLGEEMGGGGSPRILVRPHGR